MTMRYVNPTEFAILRKIYPYSVARPMYRFMKEYYGGKKIQGLEFGVGFGYNVQISLKVLNIDKFYLADPYIPYLTNDNTTLDFKPFYKKAMKLLKPYKDRIVFYEDFIENVIDKIPNDLDFVYINGCGDYENSKNYMKICYPKVKKGGIFGGYPFSADHHSVLKSLLEFVKENDLKLTGTLADWWVIK